MIYTHKLRLSDQTISGLLSFTYTSQDGDFSLMFACKVQTITSQKHCILHLDIYKIIHLGKAMVHFQPVPLFQEDYSYI